jgi:hypothetical protein
VLLDIGEEVGALVLYTSPALHSHEIEVCPLHAPGAPRVHSAVLERHINGRTVYAAVYPELQAGDYQVCSPGSPHFTINPGCVAELSI